MINKSKIDSKKSVSSRCSIVALPTSTGRIEEGVDRDRRGHRVERVVPKNSSTRFSFISISFRVFVVFQPRLARKEDTF